MSMSAIDTVYHEVIGQIDGIPIYRLKEKIKIKANALIFLYSQ